MHFCRGLNCISLLVFSYCYGVMAEITLTPINPPIEHWQKSLISYSEKRATGNRGKYTSMLVGGDLLIIDADTGQQKDRIRIGLSPYTMADDGRVFFARSEEGIIVYNPSSKTRQAYPIADLTGQDFTAKIFYVSTLKLLYVATETRGLYVMSQNADGTFKSAFSLPANQFSGSPLLSSVIEEGTYTGLLSQGADGVLYWIGSQEEDLKIFSVGGAFFPFPPVISGNFAYILVNGRVLTAVSLKGEHLQPVWQYDDFPGIATANITVDTVNSHAYIPFGRSVYCMRMLEDKCEEVWRTTQPFRQEIEQPVTLYKGNTVLVTTLDIFALDAQTGNRNWSCNQRITDRGKSAIARWEQTENRIASPAERESILKNFPRIKGRISKPLLMVGRVIYCSLSTEKILAFDPEVSHFFFWIFEPEAALTMTPAVVQGYAVAGTTKGKLHVVSENGTQHEKRTLGTTAIVACLPSREGEFYIVTRDGEIHKMMVEQRESSQSPVLRSMPNWNHKLFDDIVVPPLIDLKNDRLYVVSLNKQKIYTIDGKSRGRRSELEIDVPVKSAPQLANGLLVFGTDTGQIKAIKVNRQLQEVWSENTGSALVRGGVSTLVKVPDPRLYVGDNNGTLYAVNVYSDSNISIAWKKESNNPEESIRTTPVCDFKAVYVTYSSGKIIALTHTNEILWEQDAFLGESKPLNPIFYRLTLTNILIVPFEDGRLVALDKNSGSQLWRYQLSSRLQANLICENEYLYLLTEEGQFFSFNPSKLDHW